MTYVATRTGTPGTRIPCTDTFNRRRTVGVLPDSSTGRITLATPPGEVAVLTPREARLLARQLVSIADALDDCQRTE